MSANTKLIKGASLAVNNFEFFGKEDSREGIIFLNVIYPSSLTDFNRQLTKELNDFNALDNNLPFHPHITIARASKTSSDSSLKNSVQFLNSRINQVDWKFIVNEVAIYGVNSAIQPENQKKLITIKV